MTALNPVLTVGAQIAEVAALHGAGRAAAWARAIEMLRLVEIPDAERRADAYPHQLSGGMRQRVMLAMALACQPRLLIADEPTTALDVTIQAQVLDLLAALQQRLGMAVILVTHDLGVVAERADEIAIMYAGRIVETGDATAVLATPRIPTRAACSPRCRRPAGAAASKRSRASVPDPLAPAERLPLPRPLPRCDRRVRADRSAAARPSAQRAARVRRASALRTPREAPGRRSMTALRRARRCCACAICARTSRSAAGCAAGRRRRCARSTASPSTSPPARRSASSANPAAARPRSAAWSSACSSRPPARSSSTATTCWRSIAAALRHRRRAMQFVFQDPFGALDPRQRVGDIVGEGLAIHGLAARRRAARAGRGAAGARRPAGRGRRSLSAPVQRRAAPAHRHRPRAGARAAPDRRRRAGVRARRLGAGADRQPAPGSPGGARHRLSLHCARPAGCGTCRRSRRHHVSRAASSSWRTPPRSTPRRAIPTRARCSPPCRPPIRRCGASASSLAGEPPSPLTPPAGCPFHPRCAYAEARCRIERPALLGHRHAPGRVPRVSGVENRGRRERGDLESTPGTTAGTAAAARRARPRPHRRSFSRRRRRRGRCSTRTRR